MLQSTGLRISLNGGPVALAVAICAGLAFGAYMAVADAFLFRDVMPTTLVSDLAAPARIAAFAPRAVLDEILYRLIAMSAIVWLLSKIAGLHAYCFWLAIFAVAFIVYPAAHYTYLAGLQLGTMTILREIMLHGTAGVLWGFLFRRFGLIAAIAGHVSAHLTLQPLLRALF